MTEEKEIRQKLGLRRNNANFMNFTVSLCISIHYFYMFQQMHLLYYNTNFSVNY
jgi:hypothetical protein